MTADHRSRIDTAPLIRALTVITDRARARRASGVDDEAVSYGRIAFAALAWRAADETGDFDEAQKHLDVLARAERETAQLDMGVS